jgi:DNA-binding transcriptional ArsR family regulator
MHEKELEKQLKALANHRRIKILKYLEKIIQASVSDIAKEIKLSFKSTSRHLAVLKLAGLVKSDQQSLMMFYSLSYPKTEILKQILSQC